MTDIGFPDASDRSWIDQAADALTDEKIGAYLAPGWMQARAAGHSDDDIRQHFGIETEPEPVTANPSLWAQGGRLRASQAATTAAQAQHRQEMAARLEASGAQLARTLDDVVVAGWQVSASGLLHRGAMPDKMLPVDAPMEHRIAYDVAGIIGDLPFMIGGGFLGGAAGGPAAPITAAGGALALPQALRSSLIDAYTKGDVSDFSDVLSRATGILTDTGKAWTVGAATGAIGTGLKPLLQKSIAPRPAKVAGDEAFHYTFDSASSSIMEEGLLIRDPELNPYVYVTPNGTLSPLQAQIDLALKPNLETLRNALVRIDLAGLRKDGYAIPDLTRVARDYAMPGGGYEAKFSYPIPPRFVKVIRP
jgi:hypothetical protein